MADIRGSIQEVEGRLTHDSQAPGPGNVGTLPAVATVDAPTLTEGNQVALSVDLDGSLRVRGTEYTEGDVEEEVTGPVLMWRDSTDEMTPVTPGKPLPVRLRGAQLDIRITDLLRVPDLLRSWFSVRAYAVRHGMDPLKSGEGRKTDLICNVHGVPFMVGGHPNVVSLRANYTAAQTNTVFVSVPSGRKIVVTRVTVTADKANTVDVAVVVGTAPSTTPTTSGVIAAHPGIEAGGGFTIGDGSGILGMGADGDDLLITSEVPTTGSIDVTISYYLIDA